MQGYPKLKAFFEVLKTNYFIIQPAGFTGGVIDQAFENKDFATVVEAYLHCMDYKNLGAEHIAKVYESQDFESHIDHRLYKHLEELAKKLSLANNSRLKLNQAVYALLGKKYKETAELMRAVTSIPGRVDNSEFLKQHLFDKLNAQELSKLSENDKKAFTEALVSISEKIDNEFYANEVIKAMVKNTQAAPEVKEEVHQEDVPV